MMLHSAFELDNVASTVLPSMVDWALVNKVMLKDSASTSKHAAFSVVPTAITRGRFANLVSASLVFSKLIHHISEDHAFVEKAIAPVAAGDGFFDALLQMHRQIRFDLNTQIRQPLLIMRSDFMDDSHHGFQLVEFNGIAAGMGPFGQKIHELHSFLQQEHGNAFESWSQYVHKELVKNPCSQRLALQIASAAQSVRRQSGDFGEPSFLMIIQEGEDNIFDQHLLEEALQSLGVKTYRRTFKQIYGKLITGKDNRLLLEDVGAIDAVYLRAGYQYSDYCAESLDRQKCCEAIIETRIQIENHRVAVNATVSQQLATSKRMQLLLAAMEIEEFVDLGLSRDEAELIKPLLGEMLPIDGESYQKVETAKPEHWVLKNQGEGGGHCIFGSNILPALDNIRRHERSSWALMRRIWPKPRNQTALTIRDGAVVMVDDLISEIGIFTVYFNGNQLNDTNRYAGYLVRSKSASSGEGGVHSGTGVVDSLVYD